MSLFGLPLWAIVAAVGLLGLIGIIPVGLRLLRRSPAPQEGQAPSSLPNYARAEANARVDQLERQLGSLTERVVRLERARLSTEVQPAAQTPHVAPEAAAPVPVNPRGPITAPAPSAATDEQAVALLAADEAVERLLSAYNRIAQSGDRGGLQTFARENNAVGARETGGADLVQDDDGPLWLVDVLSDSHLMVVPSARVVQDWEKFYRQLSGMKAQADLGAAFDVRDGPALRVIAPAWARLVSDQLCRRVSRGLIEGI